MDPVRFYRWFALVPLVISGVAFLIGWLVPQVVPEWLSGIHFLIAMSVVGLPIYLPLAERAGKSLRAAASGAGLGYAYVVVMHASFAIGRRLGLIDSPGSAA